MDNYVMVVAIDFGTTYSGYAFSFKDKPEDIKMNKNWGSGVGFSSYKTPTCVLVNPQGNFDSFGYEAEDKYGKMVESEDTTVEGWSLYKQFKMILHKKRKLTRSSSISSSEGNIRPAIDIFAMALDYLKNHVLETLSHQLTSAPNKKLIKWVLTVPAIWTDESKDFMREAAFKAGLMTTKDSKQLVIALEPEAASLFCRRLDLVQFSSDHDSVSFKPGTKYMVIDAGGGTVDITAHEVLSGNKVKEIFAASGGAWGGTKVDQKFVELLEKVLGSHFIQRYQQECPQQWLNLMVSFEQVKRAVKTGSKEKLVLQLTWSFGSKYSEITGKSIEQTLAGAKEHGVSFSNGALMINQKAVRAMFGPALKSITDHIQDLMGNVKIHPCKYFFLVGGFGESTFLQEAIKEKFCGIVDILIPSEAQMSVIKGAVLFGHNPGEIANRISKRTYGYQTTVAFDEDIHDQGRRQQYETGVKCNNVFHVLMSKNDEIPIGTERSISLSPTDSKQTSGVIKFFALDTHPKTPVQYTDENGVEMLGSITVDMSDTTGGLNRTVTLNVVFGGTEIQAEAIDENTKRTTKTSLKFTPGS